jgi:Uma2 family endonuclease
MMALQTLEAQIPLEAQPESQTAPRMTSERVTEAEGISFEEYLERYSAYYYELIAGEVIKMSPVGLKHNELTDYLRTFLRMFFGFRPVGRVLGAPFPMKLPHDTRCGRDPETGLCVRCTEDAAGMYRTSQLPQFELHVPALWELIMPSSILIYECVQKMAGQVSADMARR